MRASVTRMSINVPGGGRPDGDGVLLYPEVAAQPGAATVDIYEDFQCPYCAQFEHQNGASVKALARDGRVIVVVHMMTFLDENFGNDSSRRAANAAFGAADAGHFADFHSTVFANQPDEGGGYTDDELVGFGQQVGIESTALDTFSGVVREHTYADYVAATEQRAEVNGVQGTPGFFVNGRQLSDPAVLQDLLTRRASFEELI